MPGRETIQRYEWRDEAPAFDDRLKGGQITKSGIFYVVTGDGATSNVKWVSPSSTHRSFLSFRTAGLTVLEATLVFKTGTITTESGASPIGIAVWVGKNVIDNPSLAIETSGSQEFNDTYAALVETLTGITADTVYRVSVPVTQIASTGWTDFKLQSSVESGTTNQGTIQVHQSEGGVAVAPYLELIIEPAIAGQANVGAASGLRTGSADAGTSALAAASGLDAHDAPSGLADRGAPSGLRTVEGS